jgi:ubiquinone biosynthesis protein COQ4
MSDSRKLDIPPPPPLDMRYRRALQSMRALFADPDDTEKAVDFFYAIGRREFERSFQRFAASAAGRALLEDRPSLAAAMSDRAALGRMPEASFGRAYLAFLERNGFAAMGLLELQKQVEARWDAEEGVPRLDPARAYFRERFLLAHDLFHVLTGYGTDDVGEATLLAFTLAQAPGRGQALLTIGAALEVRSSLGWRWLAYDFRAWRRGRRAAHLAAAPWEDLLPLRLDTVRSLLAIAPAEEAHPGGVLAGMRGPDGGLVLSH